MARLWPMPFKGFMVSVFCFLGRPLNARTPPFLSGATIVSAKLRSPLPDGAAARHGTVIDRTPFCSGNVHCSGRSFHRVC
jgi:hypothetical protein